MADYNSNYTGAEIDAAIAKVSGIEAGADVTDAENVASAGALMDSEVENLDAVKAFDPSDYATASQGTTADSALQALVDDTTPQLGGNLDLNGKAIPLAINAQTGTTYTAILSDSEKIITLNNASAVTMTIPANASVEYPVGTKLNFMQLGVGKVTVEITSDTLTYNSALTTSLNGQYAVATAVKISSTVWVLFGNLEAA